MTKQVADEIRKTVKASGWAGVRSNPRLLSEWRKSLAESAAFVSAVIDR